MYGWIRTGLMALAIVLVGSASTALAQQDSDDTWHRTASALAAYWFETFDAGDLDTLMQAYAEDVDVRHLSGSVTVGRESMRTALQGFIDNGVSFVPAGDGYAPVASGLLGSDGAWGRWAFHGVDGQGNVVAAGETIYIYRAIEGGWEIVSQSVYPTPME